MEHRLKNADICCFLIGTHDILTRISDLDYVMRNLSKIDCIDNNLDRYPKISLDFIFPNHFSIFNRCESGGSLQINIRY